MGNNYCDCCGLEGKVNGILNRIAIWKQFLTGLLVFIPANIHNIPYVQGYLVTDPSGNEVQINFKLFGDQSIQISSNVPLDGHLLILY